MSINEEIVRLQKIKKLYEIINEFTEMIIEKNNIEIPLKDIDYVVSLFGGRIVEGNGFARPQKIGREEFEIYVSKWDNPQQRRFYAAARLGDVLLHSNFIPDHDAFIANEKIQYKPDNGIVQQVYMSNEFASSLLMPEQIFKDIVDKYSDDDIVNCRHVAEYFDVSVSTAIERGKSLGYRWR